MMSWRYFLPWRKSKIKIINLMIQGEIGPVVVYCPAPCSGIVTDVAVVFNRACAAGNILWISRGSDIVNLVTSDFLYGATVPGLAYHGVPDVTNGQLVFDPNSSVDVNRVLKISVPALLNPTVIGLMIKYDVSAYKAQVASEA